MPEELQPTSDRTVWIEEKRPGYTRYINQDGRRWEVHGECIRLGYCLIGARIETPQGPEEVRSLGHLKELQRRLGKYRIDSEMDVPVTPEFTGCCEFTYVELEPATA